MKRFGGWVGMLGLALVACTTTEGPVGNAKPDLKEAARLNTDMGIEYMRKGKFELALEKLQKALDQDDDLGIAHSAIALLYQRRGEPKLAGKHYREAIDLNADDPATLNNFGIFLCGQREYGEAEAIFVRAAKHRENRAPADALANAGACIRRDPTGVERGEGYLREALKLNPKHPAALASLAQVSYDKKDYLRARAFLQRYELIARASAQSLWIGAQTERALGDFAAAKGYERRLRNEFPDSPEADAMQKASGHR